MVNKFIYALNAFYYFLWRIDIWITKCLINAPIQYMLYALVKFVLPKKFKKRGYEAISTSAELSKQMLYDKQNGTAAAGAIFGYIYSSYPAFIGFLISGLIFKSMEKLSVAATISTILITALIGVGYIPAYKAVFSNDKYVKYFNKFEKEDDSWRNKWRNRTLLFIIGAIVLDIIGIASIFAIYVMT